MKTVINKFRKDKSNIPLPMDIVEDDVRNRFIFTFVVISFFMLIILNFVNSSTLVYIQSLEN